MTRKIWGIAAVAAVLILVGFVAIAAEKGEKGKGFLGVFLGEVTSDIAADYGVKAGQGVLVEGVTPGSPADEAGLRENDIIVRIDEATPTGPEEFRTQLAKRKADETVSLVYLRGGREKTIQVKLAERDQERMEWGPGQRRERRFRFEGPPWEWGRDQEERAEKMAYAGIITQELSEGLAQYFRVEKGALISEVVKESPAERAGLKAGDIILRIGDKEVSSEGDVRRAIHAQKPGETTDFLISREGQQQTIKVTLGEQLGIRHHIEHELMGLGPNGIHVIMPDEAEMEQLKKELENLKIEIESIPDIDVELDKLDIPRVRVRVNTSEPIELKDEGQPDEGQQKNPQRFRDRLTDSFQRLNKQFNRIMQRAFV